ncbi:hypothetical protein [Nocardia carnea]|uniref:hypothetical protein n=1 Tax=Nocardia carnea TaxID=37328 RepID=UPI002454DF97|nr:hypothetical protein [Nocardia carnea]
MHVVVEIDGGTATVRPVHADQRGRVAARLLEVAGDRGREVRTVTSGPGAGFRVPVDIVRAAGFLPDDEPALDKPEPEAPAESAPKPKRTSRARRDSVAEAVED